MRGREHFIQILRARLLAVLGAGAPAHFLILLGGYGLGKTFTLLTLRSKLKDPSFLDHDYKILPTLVKALPPRPPARYAQYLLSKMFDDLKPELAELRKEIAQVGVDEESFLNEINPSVRNAILNIAGPHENTAIEWFRCFSLRRDQQKLINVNFNINSDDRALEVFFEFLKTMKLLKYQALVVLVDEFENILALGGAKPDQFALSYRRFFDDAVETQSRFKNIPSVIFVLACTPGAYEALYKYKELFRAKTSIEGGGIPALLDRIRPYEDVFNLEPFTNAQTEEFLKDRLEKARKGESEYPLFPFETEYPSFIRSEGQGRPRLIRAHTGTIIEGAAQADIAPISEADGRKILQTCGYLAMAAPTVEKVEEKPKKREIKIEELESKVE